VFDPDNNVVSDFEVICIEAVKQHFPRCRHIGCFFISVRHCGERCKI